MNRKYSFVAFVIVLALLSSANGAMAQVLASLVRPTPVGLEILSHSLPSPETPPRLMTPLDTPTVLVDETQNEWTVGGGRLYWAYQCAGGAPRHSGYLRQMPTHGGATLTLATTTSANCATFSRMVADDSGLYYYNEEAHRIEKRLADSPTTATIVATTETPAGKLALDANYIYYVSDAYNQILRVSKSGGSSQIAVNAGGHIYSFAVTSWALYWSEAGSLWMANTTCSSLPCPKQQLVDLDYDEAYSILAQGNYVYWVQGDAHCGEICSPTTLNRLNIYLASYVTLYSNPDGHTLGALGTNGVYLFWKESDFTNDTRLRRTSNGEVEDVATNLYNKDYDLPLFTDDQYLYFYGVSGISRLPFNAGAITRDLAVDAWEVTQGIQSTANDVPLVANKPTYVRVYGRQLSGPNTNAAAAQLQGWNVVGTLPGSPLSSLHPISTLATGGSYDRNNPDDGWLFQLPDSWTAPGILNLRAVVDPKGSYSDSNRSNNTREGTFVFMPKAPVCTVFVPVRTAQPYVSTQAPHFWSMIDLSKRLLPTPDIWVYEQAHPIEELEACWWGPFPYPCYSAYEPADDWLVMLLDLLGRDMFDERLACNVVGARTHYVGMIHPDTPTGSWGGISLPIVSVSLVDFQSYGDAPSTDWNWPWSGTTLPHELGHNYVRKHIDCGHPPGPFENYPYPTCSLDSRDPQDLLAHYGFDINTRTPIAPNAAADLMSYNGRIWISDFNWKALFGLLFPPTPFQASLVAPQTGAAPTLAEGDSAMVLVSGALTPTLSQGDLRYAWVYPNSTFGASALSKWQALAAPRVASAVHSTSVTTPTFHVRLLDANGGTVDDRAFQLLVKDSDPAGVFAFTFPFPITSVTRLDLMQDDTVLASRQPGPSAPTLTLLQPAGGETPDTQLTLVWRANDADNGDTLLYNVQYSADAGQTWAALVTDWPSLYDSDMVTLTFQSLDGIPGSAPAGARVRVAASDGYNTTMVTSQPFTVTNRPPRPYITAPEPDQLFEPGERIALRGGAMDAEDGGLSGAALDWRLLSGTGDSYHTGTGAEQWTEGLAPGSYTAVLTARDSVSATRYTETTFAIAPLRIPITVTAPTLNGVCDDPAYRSGTLVRLRPMDNDFPMPTVQLIRTATALWACFSGLPRVLNPMPGDPVDMAGIYVDVNDSRDALAQLDDYGFGVSDAGALATVSGNGNDAWIPGPGGLTAQVSASDLVWNAELRVDANTLGGWNHLVGLDLYHTFSHWPYEGWTGRPSAWGQTMLGDLPHITSLSRYSATLGSAPFTLTVTGTGFVNGATVRWNGSDRPTTFISDTQVTAAIGTTDLTIVGAVEVAIANPNLVGAISNAVSFMVNNPRPVLIRLTPAMIGPHGPAFTLTVEGTGFVNGATVLWNGEVRATTFVNNTQLRAVIDAADRLAGRAVSVGVNNPGPGGGTSNIAPFLIGMYYIYLPLIIW